MLAVVLLLALALKASGEPPPDPAQLHGPGAIAAGDDGEVWIADRLGIMRVTERHLSRVLETPEVVVSIAWGPDDALWFTEFQQPWIGRIGPDGQVQHFTEGLTGQPFSLVAGPDGNLWFTEEGRIGRITPAGAVTEFSRGLAAHSFPTDITAAPDGNLWFTDFRDRVGRVTTTGAIKEFRLPRSEFGGPNRISPAADGSLWFAWDDRLGRITRAGNVRLIKQPFDLTGDMTLGADGNIWLTGYRDAHHAGAAVARITPKGEVRLFSGGLSGGSTTGITSDSRGYLWVGESGRTGRDGVARMSVRGKATEFPPTESCRVPRHLLRLPLLNVQDSLYDSLCRLDRSSRRSGSRRHVVALRVRPRAGTELAFNSRVHVRFGPVPPIPRTCRLPFAARRLAATKHVLVFAYTNYNQNSYESRTHYGACLRPDGRPQQLLSRVDELLEFQEANEFKVAGYFVGYRFYEADHYNRSSLSLRVFDVRGGRHIFDKTVETHDGDFGADTPDTPLLGDFALSRGGAIAWLRKEGAVARIYAHGPHGATRVLDSGDLSAPAFSGDLLSWRSGSETKTATVR